MQITLVGINHKTAAVDVRQRLACDNPRIVEALGKLRVTYPGCEFVLLSTCNRVECYAAVDKVAGPDAIELAKWLADFRSVEFSTIEENLYFKTDDDVVRHLFSVTAGLDSMVIGESQITAQVKESYKIACDCQATGKILNHLFHDAFRTAKAIITNTSISSRRVSVAGVAVERAGQLFPNIRSARVLVVGAGQMGQLFVEHFQHEKCRHITVVNRSEPRCCHLAKKGGIERKPWQLLDEEIAKADIVVGAASAAEGYLFTAERIRSLTARHHRPALLIIDITVPRSFEPAIGRVQNVHLYSIDDLAKVAHDNIKLRQGDMERAAEIICNAVSAFMDWFSIRDVGPVIGEIKNAFEQICKNEVDKFFVEPPQEACRKELMEASIGRIANKLCHCVINNIDLLSRKYGADEAEKFAKSILSNAKEIISEDNKRNQ